MLAGLGIYRLVQTFWGLAVVLGLGGYTLYQAVQPPAIESGSSRPSRNLVAFVQPTVDLTPRPTPLGGYPTPSPLTIFLACDGRDGDSVRFYVPTAGGYVVLRVDVDRDAIVAILNGESTRFPPNAILIQTPCVRNLIRSGALP